MPRFTIISTDTDSALKAKDIFSREKRGAPRIDLDQHTCRRSLV